MIVGTKDVEYSAIRAHCTDVETLSNYCEMLVPRIIRHDKRIVNNQKYYIAMIVRTMQSIPWNRRKELYEGLLRGVSVTGVINTIYDFNDVLNDIDIDKLARYINGKR